MKSAKWLVFVFLIFLVYVWEFTQLIDLSLHFRKLRNEIVQMEEKNYKVLKELRKWNSIVAIEERAKKAGMREPLPGEVIIWVLKKEAGTWERLVMKNADSHKLKPR